MGIPKFPERSALPCVQENTHSSKELDFFQKLCSFLYFFPLFITVPVLLDEKVNCEPYEELPEDNYKGYRKLLREKSESYRDLLKGNCEH
jgi:hypothetical protein